MLKYLSGTIRTMISSNTSIEGCFTFHHDLFSDSRGSFMERFRVDKLMEQTGHYFSVKQVNVSQSAKNVFRGIHFAGIPSGQAKYVSVVSGEIIDYVVDLRIGSPTFGKWESFELTSTNNKSLFVAEGLGHGFLVTSEQATVSYLVSNVYQPDNEFELNPLDETISLKFPIENTELNFSDKDRRAPLLAELVSSGKLPTLEQALSQYKKNALLQPKS
jgi:dTDP-4-dehydrorhamnose 3,5-epimerase